ncbi:MAG: hypothetical protein M3O15_08415 [Acidobacteriota bacterium]|nr:hypothetical protein [Acidobacteriota bacterium]
MLTANTARQRIIDSQGKVDQTDTKITEQDATSKALKETAEQIKKIKANVAFSEKKLFVNAEDYEDYFFRLNAGYEFVNIDKLFTKGTPRVSLLVNSKVGGDEINDRIRGLHFYGARFNFAAVLNSSAEETPVLPSTANKSADAAGTTNATDTTNSKVTKSLGVELQAVVPFYRTPVFSPNNLRNYISLIGTIGGQKVDSSDRVTARYYFGLRTSINPELYSDFLFGRTDKLKSLRFEYRGQLPVYTLDNGDRVFLGGIFNVGLDKKANAVLDASGKVVRPVESDVFRVYLSWNTDLKKLLGGGKST